MVNPKSTPASASAQDPITRDFTHISTESPEIRRLTIGYGPYRGATSIPRLRLQGAWLERAGFFIGRIVKVHVSFGRLVIEAAEPERVPKAEVLERIARVSEGGLPKRELDALVRHLKRNRID
ncbi:MAG: SymE family type I addiction module toxin [Steroidobacteraceae bacterium]